MQPAPEVALRVVNHIPAMVAYWDVNLKCVFANSAYHDWFGKGPADMDGITLPQLLGPELHAKNLPYIQAALAGTKQTFERQIPLPDGSLRESIATYTPDVVDGVVLGFSVHVADVTQLRQREDTLKRALQEAIEVLGRTKRSFHSKELGHLRAQLERLRLAIEGRPNP